MVIYIALALFYALIVVLYVYTMEMHCCTNPVQTMKEETYTEEGYCSNCDQDTMKMYYHDGHERDSSGCWELCLNCRYYNSGYSRTGEVLDEETFEAFTSR